MRNTNKFIIASLIAGIFLMGCNNSVGDPADTDPALPSVNSTNAANLAVGVPINNDITATFSEAMDASTLTAATFTLSQAGTPVAGTVTLVDDTATFNPAASLLNNTTYTATISTAAKDLAGDAMATAKTWSFTTSLPADLSPVNLGSAGDFVILAKSGISTVPTSDVTGDIGVSPATAAYITGFPLNKDSSDTYAISPQVTGKIYAANYPSPTPSILTVAVGDMEAAYTNVAGRVNPTATELGAGDISGLTLVPGLYKWGTGLLISTDVTLTGDADDIWIFQVSGGVTVEAGARINLAGGALARNIFWQTFGAFAMNTTAHMEGIILSKTQITLATGASINGRLYSQTAVTLDANAVTQPAP